MGSIEQFHWIEGREGKKISAVVHYPVTISKDEEFGTIIYCHGFTGDKTSSNRMGVKLARALAKENYIVVRFDFIGSGESEGDFETDTTFSGWLSDLKTILSWVRSRKEVDKERLALIGHSLGGSLVTYIASIEEGLKCVCALAPVSKLEENFNESILGNELWSRSVKGETIRDFYGKKFSLRPIFVKDLLQYDLLSQAQNIHNDFFILHGKKDQTVPFENSCELFEGIPSKGKHLKIVDDEEHLFSDHIFPFIIQFLKLCL